MICRAPCKMETCSPLFKDKYEPQGSGSAHSRRCSPWVRGTVQRPRLQGRDSDSEGLGGALESAFYWFPAWWWCSGCKPSLGTPGPQGELQALSAHAVWAVVASWPDPSPISWGWSGNITWQERWKSDFQRSEGLPYRKGPSSTCPG